MYRDTKTEAFEALRPTLLGLAYRILGSLADAEDAVQDCFLKWSAAERKRIDDEAAWMTTVCTRRCLDMLRAAHRSRVDYVGDWLPEPVLTPALTPAGGSDQDNPESQMALASSLTTAFVLLLERLTPKERAAYLLHAIFGQPYTAIAATLDMTEASCRKLVSRAKVNVEQAKVRAITPKDRQQQLLSAFRKAVTTGSTAKLEALLSDDIRLITDGGGKVPALLKSLQGRRKVLGFIRKGLRIFWADLDWTDSDINSGCGFLLRENGTISAAVTFGFTSDGTVSDIFIIRNPDKLARLQPVAML